MRLGSTRRPNSTAFNTSAARPGQFYNVLGISSIKIGKYCPAIFDYFKIVKVGLYCNIVTVLFNDILKELKETDFSNLFHQANVDLLCVPFHYVAKSAVHCTVLRL